MAHRRRDVAHGTVKRNRTWRAISSRFSSRDQPSDIAMAAVHQEWQRRGAIFRLRLRKDQPAGPPRISTPDKNESDGGCRACFMT